MVKTEALETKLRYIGHLRFNFLWCTGYLPKICHHSLDLLIHKYPDYHRPRRIRPIMPVDIEANMHNKHLGRHSMKMVEDMDGISP